MNDKTDILLINRDEELLESLETQLRQAGYAVHTAMDMREALTTITSHPLGLIICDHALEDVNGYDFLYYLKSDPLRDCIPFVFLVPLKDQGSAFKAFEMGAIDFWVYPLEVKDFIMRVRKIDPLQPSKTPPPGSPPSSPTPPAEHQESKERRKTERVRIAPSFKIEVSRDGIVWLPGQVMNFNKGGVFVRTPLLGKQGLTLKIKFLLPAGVSIVSGEIRHIVFNSSHQQAGMGIKMEQDQEWNRVQGHLESLKVSEMPSRGGNSGDPWKSAAQAPAKTIMVCNQKEQHPPDALLTDNPRKSEAESFNIRFYQSLIGKQLDNYKAVSFIGAGAMGGVFKGWDIALEREVALKVISYELASKETFRDMFIKEARTISKLDHPNIAHIYYIGITDNILYFVMEFITGQTLKNMIDRRINLNNLKGIEYLITICQALDFVSNKHIIHRDIKPENILIDQKGSVKIVDFGVAKTIDADNPAKQEGIVGSPLYMSPDCIVGRAMDHRSDIYSLGASFYHAFTGTPPFEGKDADEVLLKHLNEPCVPLNVKNPKVSKTLGEIIERMMAKNPEDRYQDYAQIIKDIKALRSKVMKFQKLKNSTLMPRPGSI
ncbi:MAG: protein kinase domain-containing protein [Thermodesulfobacteriota bacterium]